MQLKVKNLKSTHRKTTSITTCLLLFVFVIQAQDTNTLVIDDSKNLTIETIAIKTDSILPQRFKADGVIGVVGNHIVLESDIDKMYIGLKEQNLSVDDVPRCELFGKLLEDKLLAHHAVIDSVDVNYDNIFARIDQQLAYVVEQLGSEEKTVAYYKKGSMEELRQDFFEITKTNELAMRMQETIYKDIEVTPEEVRQFFNAIPAEDLPIFGTELEIAQIVIEPKITEEAKKAVIDELNEIRRDVVENGTSFTTKVVLYSDEPNSGSTGGLITLNRKSPFVKEFVDVAFSLDVGEISEPFETEFGYHILLVERIRGQERDVRHVIKIPRVSENTIAEAKEKIEKIKESILNGEITFAEAAQSESDEKETRNNGGQLVNPLTNDTKFDLTKMEPVMSAQVYTLKGGEISNVFIDESRSGRRSFKILMVTNRIEEHTADFSKDYVKIKDLALNKKRIEAIEKWQKEKIMDTYININKDYEDCDFVNNWMKK